MKQYEVKGQTSAVVSPWRSLCVSVNSLCLGGGVVVEIHTTEAEHARETLRETTNQVWN